MRILLLASVAIILVAYASGQESTRREKLRSLISAARGGNSEARKALRDLRNKLKAHSEAAVVHHDAPQEITSHLREIDSLPQPQHQRVISIVEEPQVIPQPIRSPAPTRRERVRPQFQHRSNTFNEPHRAVNRGLEVGTRSQANANIRVTKKTRTPPVETIRRYSFFDEEGNYIFGYETADGSFKEEKRGKDCIVSGKYGYIDPDGIRREFTYVSGNKCDPNAPTDPELRENRQPLPRNNQFLVQTQQQKLNDEALNELNFNRRRRPVQSRQQEPRQQLPRQPSRQQLPRQPPQQPPQQLPRQPQQLPRQPQQLQRQPQPRQPQPRQPQQLPRQPQQLQRQPQPRQPQPRQPQQSRQRDHSRRRGETRIQTVERENIVPVQEDRVVEDIPPQPSSDPQPTDNVHPSTEAPRKPISHFRPIEPIPITSVPAFRPILRPAGINFNFDQEFKNIFSNFSHRKPQPRAAPLPPPPPPRPTPVPPTIEKPAPPKFKNPVLKPAPVFSPKEPASVAHQLVFDAATGVFKTVPLKGGIFAASSARGPLPPTPPLQFQPTVGRPLPGLSPLPPVPLGALSFNQRGSPSTREFNNFFNHFSFRE